MSEPSLYERTKAQQEREEERYKRLFELARKQGLVLVQFSARRFIVVQVAQTKGFTHTPRGYRTWLDGSIVFGPAPYDKCIEELANLAPAIPEELTKRSL